MRCPLRARFLKFESWPVHAAPSGLHPSAARLGMDGLCGWRYFPAAPAPAARAEVCAAVEPTQDPIPEPDNPVLGLP
jgi:hypothetical protein